MSVLTVGAGEEYTTIGAAVAAARSGDTIDVNAGTYTVADLMITQDLTLDAVGGTVDVVGSAGNSKGINVAKGLFVVGSEKSAPNVTIQGFSFSGAKAGSSNGAGIRYQSGNLTLNDDSFSNNQDGILATPFVDGTGTVDVTNSVFNHNGAGDGQSHNIYIGFINTFVMTDSTSEDAVVGHEVKSRAENNTIENNLITDGPTGTASYSIDLPNGGNDIIQGNTIEKGPKSSTRIAIHVGGPMAPYADTNVVIQGNTIIADPYAATAVWNEFVMPVTVTDNTIENFGTVLRGIGTQSGNVNGSGGTIAAYTNIVPATGSGTINLSTTTTPQTLTLTRPDMTVSGGSGLLTVNMDKSQETVYGGSGGIAVNDGAGMTVYTKAGSTNTITANNGSNTFFSFGNDNISVASGGGTHYDIYGTANITGSTTGSELSYVYGVENFTMRGAKESFSVLQGGTVNVAGTSGAVNAGETFGHLNFDYTESGTTCSGSISGGDVQLSPGHMAIYETATPATVDLTQGSYFITELAAATISNGGAVVDIHSGPGQLTFIGGTALAALDGSSGGANIYVGTGILNSLEHQADGVDTYNFNQAIGGGTLTIWDFRPTKDVFNFTGFTGNPIVSENVSAGSLHIMLQNHTSIVLVDERKL